MDEFYYDLSLSALETDNILVDLKSILNSENYIKGVGLFEAGTGPNPESERDYLGLKDFGAAAPETTSILKGNGEGGIKGTQFFDKAILTGSPEYSEQNYNQYYLYASSLKEGGNPTLYSFGSPVEESNGIFSQACYVRITDNGKFFAEDNSSLSLHGHAVVDIGNDSPLTKTIFNNEVDNPKIYIYDNTFINIDSKQVAQDGHTTFTMGCPTILMHGGSYFDVSAGYGWPSASAFKRFQNPYEPGNYSTNYSTANNVWPICPWESSGENPWYMNHPDVYGPLFHIHDNSSFIMDGAPVLKMTDHSVLSVEGNARVYINGGDTYNKDSQYLNPSEYGYTEFLMEPGTHFYMRNLSSTSDESVARNDEGEPMLSLSPAQIAYWGRSPAGSRMTSVSDPSEHVPFVDYGSKIANLNDKAAIAHNSLVSGNSPQHSYKMYSPTDPDDEEYNVKEEAITSPVPKAVSNMTQIRQNLGNPNSSISSKDSTPAISIENNVFVQKQTIGSASEGGYGYIYEIDTAKGQSCITKTIQTDTQSMIDINFGAAAGSTAAFEIGAYQNANLQVTLKPNNYANFFLGCEPAESSESSIIFSPNQRSQFILHCTPPEDSKCFILFHPEKIKYIVNGNDIFINYDGCAHQEMLDNARFVMRGTSEPAATYLKGSENGHRQIDWMRPLHQNGYTNSPTFQIYGDSNFCMRNYDGAYTNQNNPIQKSSTQHAPIFDMADDAQFRMYSESLFKVERKAGNGELEFTLGGTGNYAGEDDVQVTFTAQELKDVIELARALKNKNVVLSSSITELREVNSEPQTQEDGVMYVIKETV